MIYADYLVLISILALTLVNRQATLFLIVFALCEAIFLLPIDGLLYSIIISVMFSFILMKFSFKTPLLIALTAYSSLYWFSALDYYTSEYETLFAALFPYMIKAIDLFVITYLTVNKERADARSYRDDSDLSNSWC